MGIIEVGRGKRYKEETSLPIQRRTVVMRRNEEGRATTPDKTNTMFVDIVDLE